MMRGIRFLMHIIGCTNLTATVTGRRGNIFLLSLDLDDLPRRRDRGEAALLKAETVRNIRVVFVVDLVLK